MDPVADRILSVFLEREAEEGDKISFVDLINEIDNWDLGPEVGAALGWLLHEGYLALNSHEFELLPKGHQYLSHRAPGNDLSAATSRS